MKNYVVEANGGLTDKIYANVQQVVESTGGEVVNRGEGGYLMLVKASEEAVALIKKLEGVTLVAENKVRIIRRPGPGM